MKKETAVEWLFEQLKLSSKKIDEINNEHLFFYRMFVQAKAMFEEQIKDAHNRTCIRVQMKMQKNTTNKHSTSKNERNITQS
jgi:hypothetical protein